MIKICLWSSMPVFVSFSYWIPIWKRSESLWGAPGQFCIIFLLNSYLRMIRIRLGSSRLVLCHFLIEFLFGNHQNLSRELQADSVLFSYWVSYSKTTRICLESSKPVLYQVFIKFLFQNHQNLCRELQTNSVNFESHQNLSRELPAQTFKIIGKLEKLN